MESHWHCLLIMFSLNLMVMTADAELPAEVYWKMMLPTTPMPKAITDLLRADVDTDTQSKDGHSIPQLSFSSENNIFYEDFQYFRNYVTTHTKQPHAASNHEIPSSKTFFKEYQLHPGNKFYLHLNKNKSAVPLLPLQNAQKIPFSSAKIKEVMEKLSVKPGSKNAEIVENTIRECELPPMNGEEKYCATSLESMVDFITSKLGNNVLAMSTDVAMETKLQNLSVEDGVKKLADDNIITCHPMSNYPYVVFWCHRIQKTNAYFVPLEGEEDGVKVKAIAVCHRDTSKWNPKHIAFQELNVKPGTVPVCHFFPEGHLLWLPN